MTVRMTCADCGAPTDNHSLLCDRCTPDYRDVPAAPAQPSGPPWADETDGDCA